MTRCLFVGLLATVVSAGGCRQADAAKAAKADSAVLARREARLDQSLAQRDTIVSDTSDGERKAIARWILPSNLDELSGVAITDERHLLAHGDERAQISEIDFRTGVITKQFVVGRPTLKADLEGITIARGLIFLLASNGTIYEFREGANGQRVDYTTHDTRLGKECEFEGIAFDSVNNALLLSCKNVNIKHLEDAMVIYRWRIDSGGDRLSRLSVPLDGILKAIDEKALHPSDITVDPFTGNYVLIASIEKAIVEITPEGQVVFARRLPGDHDQPESVAITRDSILIIGDEAKHRPAVLTLYPWP